MENGNQDLTSLLDLEDGSEQTPAPATGEPGQKPSTSPDDGKEKIAELTESNKELQEKVRQLSETNKGFQEFLDRLRGDPKTADEKKRRQELLIKFDEDPAEATRQIIQEELAGVKNELILEKQTNIVDRAMREVNRDYNVDWDNDWQKISAQLKNFDMDVKKSDPKGTLIAACKLANCITKKAQQPNGEPPLVEGNTKSGSRPAPKKHSDTVNERLNTIGKRKKTNVFGI